MVDGMIGPYRLLTRIASGAQATVYRATDTRNKGLVALKVLDPRLASDPAQRKRLERALANLERKVERFVGNRKLWTFLREGRQVERT